MPLPRHPGLPGSQVIPEDWAAAHAPVVDKTFDCTVRIGPAGGAPVFNPATRRTEVPDVTPLYVGSASVSPAGSGATSDGTRTDVADDQVDDRTYLVKLPAGDTAAVQPEDVITVTASPNPRLVGAGLVVISTPRPGREFSRGVVARLFE